MNAQHHAAALLNTALILVTSACGSDVTQPGFGAGVRVNVFANTATGGSGAPSFFSLRSSMRQSDVQSIRLSRVALVLGGVKLEAAGNDATVDWIDASSRVVETNLQGEPTFAVEYDVPEGSYKEVEIWIDKLEEGNPTEEPLIGLYPELSNASVVAEGTVMRDDGSTTDFLFATDLDRDLEIDLEPVLRIDGSNDPGGGTVIAIALSLDDWFSDGAGGLLDPADEQNRSAIESNIGSGVAAFEDLDEDGTVDD